MESAYTNQILNENNVAGLNIRTWGGIIDFDNTFWLPVLNTNSLIKGNECGKFEYVGELFTHHQVDDNCIIKILETERNLFFFSRKRYDVCIVDKDTLIMKNIHYCMDDMKGIADIVQVDKYAIILSFSVREPAMFFDLEKQKSEIIYATNAMAYGDTVFIRGVCRNNSAYTATRHLNNVSICRIDPNTKKAEYYKLDVMMINAICTEGDNWWVFALDNYRRTVLRKYNGDFRECREEYGLDEIEKILESGIIKYFRIESYGEKIFFIPSFANNIYVYDTISGAGKYLDYPDGLMNTDAGVSFVEIQKRDKVVYLFPYGYQQILKLNMENNEINLIDINMDSTMREKIKSIFANELNGVIKEGFPITLDGFLNVI